MSGMASPDLDWPDERMVLVVTDGAHYREAVPRVAAALTRRCHGGVVIAANRPAQMLRQTLREHGVDLSGVSFIDCISSVAGLPPTPERDVQYIESPTMLEKMGLRAERALTGVPGTKRFLILDSLSTLAMYNGVAAVAEFTHNVATRMRLLDVEGALILVENVAEPGLLDAVRPLFDRTIEA